MNKPVSFPVAKLLKEKGFDIECEYFYSKHGGFNSLKPHREYEHLHSYSEQLVSYFDGKYDWNSLDVDEGMIALKTAFSESDGYVNCECSAPTIAEVVMWLYEKHGVWCHVMRYKDHAADVNDPYEFTWDMGRTTHKTPTKAYEAAIEYALKTLVP